MREEGVVRLNNIDLKKTDQNFLVYVYLYETLKKSISQYAKGTILDIGCGNKPYLPYFKHLTNITYTGCDVIQSSLGTVDILCEATQIPLPNESFDTIFSTQTIEHVFDHNGMLKESNRLLKKNGHIIVSGPMYWPHHEEPYDYFRFTKHGFHKLLVQNGFDVIKIIPNGGKWSLFGVVVFHTFPKKMTQFRFFKFLLNSICYYLDRKHPDHTNTCNFVAIAKKSK